MNNSAYSICNQATKDDMIEFKNQLTKFGDLNYFRHKTPLKNYPKIPDFLNSHTLSITYFFPIYKCNDARCLYHELLRGQKIEKSGSSYRWKQWRTLHAGKWSRRKASPVEVVIWTFIVFMDFLYVYTGLILYFHNVVFS